MENTTNNAKEQHDYGIIQMYYSRTGKRVKKIEDIPQDEIDAILKEVNSDIEELKSLNNLSKIFNERS